MAEHNVSAYLATGRAKHPADAKRTIAGPLTKAMRDKPKPGTRPLHSAPPASEPAPAKAGEFTRFLNAIEAEIPAGPIIHVILANYRPHKHPKTRAWLARHARFVFHYTPTSASWLNAIEGFFAKLAKRRLKRGVFCSIVDLQAAINRFLRETNDDPKPFVWTADSDEIIAVRRGHQTSDSIRQPRHPSKLKRLLFATAGSSPWLSGYAKSVVTAGSIAKPWMPVAGLDSWAFSPRTLLRGHLVQIAVDRPVTPGTVCKGHPSGGGDDEQSDRS